MTSFKKITGLARVASFSIFLSFSALTVVNFIPSNFNLSFLPFTSDTKADLESGQLLAENEITEEDNNPGNVNDDNIPTREELNDLDRPSTDNNVNTTQFEEKPDTESKEPKTPSNSEHPQSNERT